MAEAHSPELAELSLLVRERCEDQQRDRSDDPDIAETVLRFIPFSAAHEESAVSFPSPQKQLRCTVHPDYASRRRHWLRWC
jgi:hypothetical protein